ncbi:hypothetical protein C6W91_07880 [Phaeobacter sp. SYSU ZJ3003]
MASIAWAVFLPGRFGRERVVQGPEVVFGTVNMPRVIRGMGLMQMVFDREMSGPGGLVMASPGWMGTKAWFCNI